MSTIRFYYKLSDSMYYITSTGNELIEDTVRNLWTNKQTIHHYECFKGYDASLEGLMKFREDFTKWAKEISPLVDYTKYYSNSDAVMCTFKKFSTRQLNRIQIDPIVYTECFYLEAPNNGGWMRLNSLYQGKTIQTYGYDQTSFYPYLLGMSDFKLPIKQGHEYYLDALDFKNLKYGIYRCDITSDYDRFKDIFTFSKRGYYTHLELKFAYKYRKMYDVTIKLIVDEGDYNCLLYEESDLIESKTIFNNWYVTLLRAKKMYPDNKVAKHLMSSLWGYLTQYRRMMCDDEGLAELDISHISDPEETEFKLIEAESFLCKTRGTRDRFTYIKSVSPYKHDLARIKPFFTSYARNYMVNLLISEGLVTKFVRAHTDNICLTVEHDFSHLPYYPVVEKKTTGRILWRKVNDYVNFDDKESKSYKKYLKSINEKT